MRLSNLAFFLIFVIGILLRVWNLDVIPEWDWDDGVNMNIAWNLINGRLQWFSLGYVFVPHPPLFFIILGVLLKVFGNEVLVLRSLTVMYSLATLIFVYLIGKEIFNRNTALLASFIFAIYPDAIYWDRIGFANTQLMFFSLISLYFVLRFFHQKRDLWIYLASIAVGLSTITEFQGIMFLISLLLIFLIYERKNFPRVFLLSSSFFIIFIVIMLFLFPDAFIHDMNFQLERFGLLSIFLSMFHYLIFLIIPLIVIYFTRNWIKEIYLNSVKKIALFINLMDLRGFFSIIIFFSLFAINSVLAFSILRPFSDEILFHGITYFWLGILGIFLIDRKMERNILLLFFLPIFLFILKIGRSDHMLIPLYPFLSLGMAIFLQRIFDFLNSFSRFRILSVAILILLLYPFTFLLYQDVSAFIFGNGLIAEDIEGRYEVAEFVNNYIDNDDIVIADSHLCRLIKCKTSVLLQVVAIDGSKIAYMAPDYGKDRFVFNCSYSNAKFIIISSKDMEWMEENAKENEKVKEIYKEIENWQLVEINGYGIYRNPALSQ